jgi:hypothetical protein
MTRQPRRGKKIRKWRRNDEITTHTHTKKGRKKNTSAGETRIPVIAVYSRSCLF